MARLVLHCLTNVKYCFLGVVNLLLSHFYALFLYIIIKWYPEYKIHNRKETQKALRDSVDKKWKYALFTFTRGRDQSVAACRTYNAVSNQCYLAVLIVNISQLMLCNFYYRMLKMNEDMNTWKYTLYIEQMATPIIIACCVLKMWLKFC